MSDRIRPTRGLDASSPLVSVVIPVALLFAAIAIVAGLVFGGVLQGHGERGGPAGPQSTPSTMIIEP